MEGPLPCTAEKNKGKKPPAEYEAPNKGSHSRLPSAHHVDTATVYLRSRSPRGPTALRGIRATAGRVEDPLGPTRIRGRPSRGASRGGNDFRSWKERPTKFVTFHSVPATKRRKIQTKIAAFGSSKLFDYAHAHSVCTRVTDTIVYTQCWEYVHATKLILHLLFDEILQIILLMFSNCISFHCFLRKRRKCNTEIQLQAFCFPKYTSDDFEGWGAGGGGFYGLLWLREDVKR